MSLPPIVELVNGALPAGPQFWLDAATAEVRRFCEWHVTPKITQKLVLDGPGGKHLLIPSGHLVKVSACTSDGEDVLNDLDPSEKGILSRRAGFWSERNSGVTLTIEHGHEDAPDVAGIIAAVAARGASSPGAVVSQAAGPMNVRYATVGGAPVHIPLLESEKDTLRAYKLGWGV